jgi:hypothetical protein
MRSESMILIDKNLRTMLIFSLLDRNLKDNFEKNDQNQ